MKYCEFCDVVCEDAAGVCPSCGGNEFYHKCPSCGKDMHGAIFCQECGIRYDAKSSVCPTCRTPYFGASCPRCANARPAGPANTYSAPAAPQGRAKNKWVALILCFFLGFYGAHKFYEGKAGMGLVYLFTAGLFGIGWIVDIIRIAVGPETYYV